ncbi:MAG: RNA-binding S4 domain-containing protein [Desulfotomaculum sp.]|nr:RNA-binding S4 domain-containing protein [Desulfotomaculum sp.]
MRLDKFLKVSRIIKRRPVAKEVCESGKVKLNNRVAKAGSSVKPGDVLEIEMGRKTLKIKILTVKETVPAREAVTLYEVLEEVNYPPEDLL